MAKNANINISRFNAVYGKELPDNHPDIIKYFTIDNNLSKCEIGCALSHIKIWEDAIKNNYNNIIVFEDDAIIFDNFWDNLQNTYNCLPDKWNILYLDISYGYLQKINNCISRVVYKERKNFGMIGYILNKNIVNKIISQFNNGYKLNVPIDVYIANLNNNDFYMTYPNLITFSNIYSNILDKTRDLFNYKKITRKTYIK
jgi:glycosyl transferase family 25